MNQPTQYPESQTLISQNICLIVGLACLLGFFVDVVVIGLPPEVFSLEWRMDFAQQLADRSILLLAGVGLLLYGVFKERDLTKKLSRICLIVGVIYVMSSILVIHDAVALREQTFQDLNNQKRELQTTIESSQATGQLPPEISPSEVERASKSIDARAEAIRRDTSRDIIKVGVATVGNMIAVGLGLMGLSRVGLKRLNRYL